MKKLLSVIAIAVIAVALRAADSQTHVFVRANPPMEIENVDTDGALPLKKSQSDPTGRHALQNYTTAKDDLRSVKVAFKADRDGLVIVRLFSAKPRWGGKSTAVGNITVNGKPVNNADFSKVNEKTGRPAGFITSSKAESRPELIPAADGKPAMLRCSAVRSLGIPIRVKGGEPVVFSVDMMGMDAYPGEAGAQK